MESNTNGGSMTFQHVSSISNNFISLFQNHEYEQYVLFFMNQSKNIFPGKYKLVKEQSHGECDFIEETSQEKFDAKLPFTAKQIQLLTSGKKHEPLIIEWLKQMQSEASDYDSLAIRSNPNYDIANTKLYQIMKDSIEKDKIDEHIVFFLPYPISLSVEDSIFLQFAGDYLKAIYTSLRNNINLYTRKIYVIYPSSKKNQFALRDLSSFRTEYIMCEELEQYFSYEIVSVK